MDTEPYHDYRRFLEKRYGETLYRIPIDFGLGCPHRNPDGSGGCTFCSEEGGRAKQTLAHKTVEKQVQAGIEFASSRYGATRFTAYIQAFTGTFASTGWQRQQYEKLLKDFPFTAVNIGTRPDCLSEDTLDFLEELQHKLDVWVELGVQSVHDDTLKRINRGHTWKQNEEAIAFLKSKGVNVAPHIILGLPGEGTAAFRATACELNKQPIDALKIHNLHVLKGTRLAEEYEANPFPVLNEHAYAETLIDFLRRLSPDIPLMRLVTDSEPNELIAPRWEMHKGQFLSYLTQLMQLRNVRQGDLISADARPPAPRADDVHPKREVDGSFTFWNAHYKEHYHCPLGARSEAAEKYVSPANIAERLQENDVHVLDICFGMGYNTLVACNTAARVGKHDLRVSALDMDRLTVGMTAVHMDFNAQDAFDWASTLRSLYETSCSTGPNFSIDIRWGDARYTIHQIPTGEQFDVIFLDPFSSQRSSTLWTVDFFKVLRARMAPHGILLTYSTAIPVRAGLRDAGFYIGNTPAFGREKGGTTAALDKHQIRHPLGDKDTDLLQTPKGTPYRDPSSTRPHKEILRQREEIVRKAKKDNSCPSSA